VSETFLISGERLEELVRTAFDAAYNAGFDDATAYGRQRKLDELWGQLIQGKCMVERVKRLELVKHES
jgi:hypothetical protein